MDGASPADPGALRPLTKVGAKSILKQAKLCGNIECLLLPLAEEKMAGGAGEGTGFPTTSPSAPASLAEDYGDDYDDDYLNHIPFDRFSLKLSAPGARAEGTAC